MPKYRIKNGQVMTNKTLYLQGSVIDLEAEQGDPLVANGTLEPIGEKEGDLPFTEEPAKPGARKGKKGDA